MSQIKPIAHTEKEQNYNLRGILPSRCITDCFPKGRLEQTRTNVEIVWPVKSKYELGFKNNLYSCL